VDSLYGNDLNRGTTETTPWKTVKHINMQPFAAGDVLLFRRGREWFDVMINVESPDLTIGAYGTGAPPRLVGSIEVSGWESHGNGIYYTYFPRPASRKNWDGWEVQLVMETGNEFYKKVSSIDELRGNGQFYYDKPSQNLYIKPLDPVNSLGKTFYVGRQENVIEIKHARIDRLVVRDLEITLANRYGIGVWWQGDKERQGSVLVENNTFIGNAFSAVCLSGFMSYDRITIRNNTIRMSGCEGIYIGRYAARTAVEITGNTIGDPADSNYGWRGAGPTSSFNGDGILVKTGNRGLLIAENTIRHLTGYCGICFGSGDALITKNLIQDVRMPGSAYPVAAAGIYTDIDDRLGVPVIKGNRISMSDASGIHIRGNYDLHPPMIVEENDIMLTPSNPNAQIEFTVMNSHNVEIKGNHCRGGAYGFALAANPPYPPVAFLVKGNDFLMTSASPFYFAQPGPGDLKGMTTISNKVCKGSPVYIEWKSGARVSTMAGAKSVLGPNSIIEAPCP
jgi:hypothetical protein